MTAVIHTDDRLLVAAPTALLVDLLDPFLSPPWDGCPAFGRSEVRDAIAAGRLHGDPIRDVDYDTPDLHIDRIAWLAVNWVNDGTDPPVVEALPYADLIVNDGYHRICAAAVRGDAVVWVEVGGWLDAAEDLFDITIP